LETSAWVLARKKCLNPLAKAFVPEVPKIKKKKKNPKKKTPVRTSLLSFKEEEVEEPVHVPHTGKSITPLGYTFNSMGPVYKKGKLLVADSRIETAPFNPHGVKGMPDLY
jgi:hypothetical protein